MVDFALDPVVYVAALTYKRPGSLSCLIDRLAELVHPERWEIRFLVVDNDPEGSAQALVQRKASAFAGVLRYVIEPEPGIAPARNRALREALLDDAKLLCFIDDDETPDSRWLMELVAHWQRTGAVLIGGPQHRTLPDAPLPWFKRQLARSLISRRLLAERGARRAALKGRAIPVMTSNWMCDLDFVRKWDLRFDPAMRFSGGEDVAFDLAVRKCGGATSWCPDAVVSEEIAPERLSLHHQWSRSRAQGLVMAGLLAHHRARVYPEQLARLVTGLGLMVIPVFGIASFTMGIHLAASSLGHLAYLGGQRSAHYGRDDQPGSPKRPA